MKKYLFLFATLFFALTFYVSSAILVIAHPIGGVSQRTVISELRDAILIEYNTYFGPDAVFTQYPDKDFNGVLDAVERKEFLERAQLRLFPHVSCLLGTRKLDLQEIDRQLRLEDTGDFEAGLHTRFVWQVSLTKEERSLGGLLRITDKNFKAGAGKQLSYAVNVLGQTGPMTLADEGRELAMELSAEKSIIPDSAGALSGRLPQAPGTGWSAASENKSEAEADSLVSFLKNESGGIGFYLVGIATAFLLGALHALSPGHGKAIVAAYLIGTRGRVIDAVRLGAVVTMTHVFSVVVLGVVALVLSHYTLSQDIYPWLGVASGGIIFLTGYFLLARTAFAASVHNHHDHDHSHIHQHMGHDDGSHNPDSLKEIISLGVAGGLVPCPSAIVILLFAIAINRIVTGLLLILSFSLGLAAVLILIGILTVTASKRLERFGSGVGWIKRLPIFTAGIIMVLGVAISLNALYQAGILVFNL